MIDIRRVRQEPDAVVAALSVRGTVDAQERIDRLLALDLERRDALNQVNELKALRNQVSKAIGDAKRSGEDASAEIARMREVGERIQAFDDVVSAADAEIRTLLLATPNTPDAQVPAGDEDANELLRTWGEPLIHAFEAKPHWELGEVLGLFDLARGSKISGSGFPVMKGKGARLQRGLINWMIERHQERSGYEELRVPYLVTSETLTGTGQLPKFSEESYLTERDDLWLIPTAEVPVTNLHRDELLSVEDLPLKYTAYSPCFRREAGAAGKDTRGLLRVHQFDKVELVRIENPADSEAALEELTQEAAGVLEALDLPYRVLRLAGGDLGFSAAMTYDIEVWAPGVDRWLEVSSCSTFTDFQARRANIRFRPEAGAKPEYVHTLNGSALALPRLIVALLETYQQADGSVVLPDFLGEYVGFTEIRP